MYTNANIMTPQEATTRVIHAEAELALIVVDVLARLEKKDRAHVIALRGDLGAGKTAFTKAFARTLGITEYVTSPTFVIMKSYAAHEHPWIKTLTHIDAYRVDDDGEMRVLGFESLLSDPERVICIEWPERIHAVIPPDAFYMSIEIGENGERTFTYGK